MYKTTDYALKYGFFFDQLLGTFILLLIFFLLVFLIYWQIRLINNDTIGKWIIRIKKEK